MKRLLACLVLTVCFCSVAFAQSPKDEQNEKMLKQAADKATKAGAGLTTQITVANNVTASSVLIPRTDAERIFGKEIATKYMVIEVNVGNKSPDAALIIHGIFMDYSGWAFAGKVQKRSSNSANDDPSAIYQASTRPNEVASEEYRVVRGQLLDAQMWTKRNWTVRMLTLAGNLAGAYTFALKEKGIIQGIAAATGVGVPGFATAFPDPTVEQLNRVSDFGYRANSLIPKQGAGVIVCFFPIDRFLSPGFRKLFLKSPALFYAPGQMLLDKKINKDVVAVLGADLGIQANLVELAHALPCFLSVVDRLSGVDNHIQDQPCLDDFGLEERDDGKVVAVKTDYDSKKKAEVFRALAFLSRASLNSVTLTVDGVMSVDITTIPAKIDDIAFDTVANCGDDKQECFWADAGFASGVRTGTIPGSYLTGGDVAIAEASALGLTEVKAVTDGSSDQALHFSFKMTKGLPTGTKLHFKVTKPKPGVAGVTIDSQPWEYVVDYALGAPLITKAELAGSTLTVTGTGFFNRPAPNGLVVTLQTPSGDKLNDLKLTSSDSTKLVLDIPADKKTAGCWMVLIYVGAQRALPPQNGRFAVPPSPTLVSAKWKDKSIELTGTDFVDTGACGAELSFQLVKAGSNPIVATGTDLKSTTQATLDLPPAAKTGSWMVKVLLGGKETGSVALQPK
jgi:hypothetical protein